MVAVRETREETGLALEGELIPIQRYLPSPGASDESVFLFCARIDSTAAVGLHGVTEEGEDIRVVVKTMAEVEALLDAGLIENGHTLVALYWLLRHRYRLRRLWRTKSPQTPNPLSALGVRNSDEVKCASHQAPRPACRVAKNIGYN